MKKTSGICVEIKGVFYRSLSQAGKTLRCRHATIKRKCLSDDCPEYVIVPFRVTYIEKECSKCETIKPLKEFNELTGSQDGVRPECRECQSKYGESYRRDNPEKVKDSKAKWKKDNPDYNKTWKKNNPEKVKENKRRDKEKNADYYKEYWNVYRKLKRKNDPAFRVNANMSSGIWWALKGGKNGRHWETLVDYDLEELMVHLESLFTEGMNWDNYGWGDNKWHIDHKKAKSLFNITSAECQDFKDCWALSNLQPLWQPENFKKGNR